VHELHDGHLALFSEVRARHNRVILFLGQKPIGMTYNNPLDFETRKAMIQAKFPDFLILPLTDTKEDATWSRTLDSKIGEIADFGDVTLYGGRDSFVPHYTGRFKPVELNLPISITSKVENSGTYIRNKLTNTIMESADFRAGVIYALTNIRPSVKATVDVVITHDVTGDPHLEGLYILLGRKPGESLWRFPGGFSEPDGTTYEFNAKREAMEETGLSLEDLTYIGSAAVPDWRWNGEPDQIKTSVFTGKSITMGGKAADDLAEIKWFNASDLHDGLFIDTHRVSVWPLVKKHFKLNQDVADEMGAKDLDSLIGTGLQ
jgi:bifunctional NMN adenylyltransferase/nudix hydrolase